MYIFLKRENNSTCIYNCIYKRGWFVLNLLFKQKVLIMVRALYFCMEEQWAELGKKYNISPAQQHILFLLSTNKDALTPTQISKLGCWHISTVTRLLKPMRENGIISIKIDEKQPRYKKVTLTADGQLLLNNLISTAKEMERFPLEMSHFSESEVANFLELGESILDVHKGKDFKDKVLNAQMKGCNYA
jgi:MarR family protease production transcriptional regulator HPr